MLHLHIAAGGAAIVLGALALLVRKGSPVHRTAGVWFVYAMVAMGVSGALLGVARGDSGNVVGGLTATYFVVTAMFTVRAPSRLSRMIVAGACATAVVVGVIEIALAARTVAAGHMFRNGVPVPMQVFLASVTLGAAAGDLRVLRSGPLRGAPRLRRHLWRMCFALFIAAGSFFSIRARVARVLPEPFLSAPMRMLPIILVFVAMAYWLWRPRAPRTPATLSHR